MFISAIIPLTALYESTADGAHFLGREAHALFLDLVRRADPALADSLHQPRGDKPFTVAYLSSHSHRRFPSPNLGSSAEGKGDNGSRVRFLRFTAFEPRLTQLLIEGVLPNLPREVRLGNTRFQTGTAIHSRAAHPWAGAKDTNALIERWFGKGEWIEKRLELEFASPTAHRQIHRNVLVPQPAQLWGGWLRAWNAHAQPAFEEDLIARVE